MQNKAKSEDNERSNTKGFSNSVNKFTTIITSFNMFVANGPAYRTTYNIILSAITVPFFVCRISVNGSEFLQFYDLKVILHLTAELGIHIAHDTCRCSLGSSLLSSHSFFH